MVAAISEREGVWPNLSTAEGRGPEVAATWPGVQELPVARPGISAGKEVLGCLSSVRLASSQSARPVLCSPSSAKSSGCTEKVFGRACHPVSARQTSVGEGGWTALIRSGLPRDWPSCLEKPGAGRCGKWLFGFAAELLNFLDHLASPLSLLTRTRQLFRTGRGIQG